MDKGLNRDQLIRLVEQLISGQGTEDEQGEWLDLIDRSVPAPTGYVNDLIFWSDRQMTIQVSDLDPHGLISGCPGRRSCSFVSTAVNGRPRDYR